MPGFMTWRYGLAQEHLQPELPFSLNDLDFGYPNAVAQSRLIGSLGQPSSRILDTLGDTLLQQQTRALEQQLKLQQESRLLGAIKTLDKAHELSYGAGATGAHFLSTKEEDLSPRKRQGEPLSPSILDQADLLPSEEQTTTGERRVRMREKNRNAQRRYRERQKAQISRMQAEIDELTEKLQRCEEEKAITLEQNKLLIREMQQMQQVQSKRQKLHAAAAALQAQGSGSTGANATSATATHTVASPQATGSNTDL